MKVLIIKQFKRIYFFRTFSFLLILFFIIFNENGYFASGENFKSFKNSKQQENPLISIKLIFVGDIMQHMPQVLSAFDSTSGKYDYTKCFQFIKPIISNSDFAIANLETTLGNKPYSGYPQFSSPDELLDALKASGFQMLLTANNHCLDRGKYGLERTISKIDSLKFYHLGTYKDLNSRNNTYPLIVDVKGIKIAFFNYTFSTNQIQQTPPNIVNYIDTIQMSKDIESAKKSKPDFMVMTIHWGDEYKLEPNNAQKKVAMFCLKKGIDIIIGSHPHVIEPIEEVNFDYNNHKKNGLIYYSLGNVVSCQTARYTNGGIIAEINITKDFKKDSTYFTKYGYYPTYVHKENVGKNGKFYIFPIRSIEKDSVNIRFTESDKNKINIFKNDTKKMLGEELEIK